MTVGRRSVLRSAAALVPAMGIGGAPGVVSAATTAPSWQVFPVQPGSGAWFRFSRIGVAANGTAKALGTNRQVTALGALATGPDGALWMAGSRETSSSTSVFFAELPVAV
ncbi:hypothetical protein [Kitasatospora sp. NPDC057500]|uniref:hypothetical protein n=1 Tax=Kitasatospora sp. NPDC057500 TaxID=3346151 RepID=UPI003696071F